MPNLVIGSRTFMAMSAGLQTTTGYGSAASAAHSIPMLDGNKKPFKDFQYKLRACALELVLELQ